MYGDSDTEWEKISSNLHYRYITDSGPAPAIYQPQLSDVHVGASQDQDSPSVACLGRVGRAADWTVVE